MTAQEQHGCEGMWRLQAAQGGPQQRACGRMKGWACCDRAWPPLDTLDRRPAATRTPLCRRWWKCGQRQQRRAPTTLVGGLGLEGVGEACD